MKQRSLFYKKIQCAKCGGNFKSKKERGRVKYLCSTYDNGKGCERIVYPEEKLIEALQRRYRRELSHEEIRDVVHYIVIQDDHQFAIHLYDGEPIRYEKNRIVF